MYKSEICVTHVNHFNTAFRDLHADHVPNDVKHNKSSTRHDSFMDFHARACDHTLQNPSLRSFVRAQLRKTRRLKAYELC